MQQEITPEIFIETLAEMLEEERERKAARILTTSKASAIRFMNRLQGGHAGRTASAANVQHNSQAAQRFIGQLQNSHGLAFSIGTRDPQFQE